MRSAFQRVRGNGVRVALFIDANPVVPPLARAAPGTESPAELEADTSLRSRRDSIRLQAGPLMHLGDVTDTTVP